MDTAVTIDDPRWRAFVESRPEALPFHLPEWARLLADCYGFRAFALLSGQGGLPVVEVRRPLGGRRWVSLPFTDACPPLGDPAGLLEGDVPLDVHAPVPGFDRREVGYVHTLRLDRDPEAVFATFSRSQVQQIVRRAERSGAVSIRRGDTAADLVERFYGLHLRTRRRQGVPVQPRRFFELLWERLLEPGLGFVLLAEAEGETVAGAVFLSWNGTVVYKYGASDDAGRRLRANNLLLWSAIRWGCEEGFHTFDFGRTDTGNEGLRVFKQGWGTEEAPLVYSTMGGTGRDGAGAARALETVIKRSPAFVCRGIGELLYRYAA